MKKIGIAKALEKLKQVYPLALFADKIYQLAGCNVAHGSLDRKLRYYAEIGQLEREKAKTLDGEEITLYKWNPNLSFLLAHSSDWFFFTVRGSKTPSGYYLSIDSLMADARVNGLKPLHIYSGTHDRPVLWEAWEAK